MTATLQSPTHGTRSWRTGNEVSEDVHTLRDQTKPCIYSAAQAEWRGYYETQLGLGDLPLSARDRIDTSVLEQLGPDYVSHIEAKTLVSIPLEDPRWAEFVTAKAVEPTIIVRLESKESTSDRIRYFEQLLLQQSPSSSIYSALSSLVIARVDAKGLRALALCSLIERIYY